MCANIILKCSFCSIEERENSDALFEMHHYCRLKLSMLTPINGERVWLRITRSQVWLLAGSLMFWNLAPVQLDGWKQPEDILPLNQKLLQFWTEQSWWLQCRCFMDLHDPDEWESTLSGQKTPNKQVRASYWMITAWAIICQLATIKLRPTDAESSFSFLEQPC